MNIKSTFVVVVVDDAAIIVEETLVVVVVVGGTELCSDGCLIKIVRHSSFQRTPNTTTTSCTQIPKRSLEASIHSSIRCRPNFFAVLSLSSLIEK